MVSFFSMHGVITCQRNTAVMEKGMNLKNKKTVLNDDASIYQQKEAVSEKEKWKRRGTSLC